MPWGVDWWNVLLEHVSGRPSLPRSWLSYWYADSARLVALTLVAWLISQNRLCWRLFIALSICGTLWWWGPLVQGDLWFLPLRPLWTIGLCGMSIGMATQSRCLGIAIATMPITLAGVRSFAPGVWRAATLDSTGWLADLMLVLPACAIFDAAVFMEWAWRTRVRMDQSVTHRCAPCGYSLTGLKHTVCPECGAPFELGGTNNQERSLHAALAGGLPCRALWLLMALGGTGLFFDEIYPSYFSRVGRLIPLLMAGTWLSALAALAYVWCAEPKPDAAVRWLDRWLTVMAYGSLPLWLHSTFFFSSRGTLSPGISWRWNPYWNLPLTLTREEQTFVNVAAFIGFLVIPVFTILVRSNQGGGRGKAWSMILKAYVPTWCMSALLAGTWVCASQ